MLAHLYHKVTAEVIGESSPGWKVVIQDINRLIPCVTLLGLNSIGDSTLPVPFPLPYFCGDQSRVVSWRHTSIYRCVLLTHCPPNISKHPSIQVNAHREFIRLCSHCGYVCINVSPKVQYICSPFVPEAMTVNERQWSTFSFVVRVERLDSRIISCGTVKAFVLK